MKNAANCLFGSYKNFIDSAAVVLYITIRKGNDGEKDIPIPVCRRKTDNRDTAVGGAKTAV